MSGFLDTSPRNVDDLSDDDSDHPWRLRGPTIHCVDDLILDCELN